MGEERNQPNQKHKTKLDILNYVRKKKKEIKDSIIRDIQTPLETKEEKKKEIREKKKLVID